VLDPSTVVEMGDRGMAKYGIIRIQKFHKDAILGVQKHNQRESEETNESETCTGFFI